MFLTGKFREMKRCFLILSCLLGILPLSLAQYSTLKDLPGKSRKLYDEALAANAIGQYAKAVTSLDEVLKKTPDCIDAILLRSDLKLLLGEAEEARSGFEKAIAMAPEYNTVVYKLIALAEIELEAYDQAAGHLEQYLASDRLREKNRQEAEILLANTRFIGKAKASPVLFEPHDLGDSINTADPEYLPFLTADEQYLVYTTRVANRQEDLFVSEKKDGRWQKGEPMESLNSPFNESRPTLTANGRFMVFARDDRRGDFNLLYTHFRKGKWTPPQPFSAPINTGGWESQPSLSSDGRQLFFASDRAGGKGRSDIWVTTLQADGQWGAPENLGGKINTVHNEQAPFIHPDGQSLYFMSKGHPGMGEFDLFLSRKMKDGTWGTPKNLGYPINTKNNEGALFVSLDGQTAYFDSDQQDPTQKITDMGNADIFYFELYPEARPQPVTYVKATVKEMDTERPLTAKAEIINLETEKLHLAVQTSAAGSFLVTLPVGKDYSLNVSAEGYIFHSENFALREVKNSGEPFLLEIFLQPIPEPEGPEVGDASSAPVILKNVFFATGSAELLENSRLELSRLQKLLTDYSKLKIRINGHTDQVGEENANLDLSQNRAKAVYDWLIANGINADRLDYKGFGESNPIAPNDTPDGRQRNRRVEFEVIN